MAGVTALTASLGGWQLRRAEEKTALQAQTDRAATAAPIALGGVLLEADAIAGRAVSVRGRFVPAGTVFIDNRTHQGVAGFHVLTPVKIPESALHVLVLRGWVARDVRDRNRLPAVPTPAGDVDITGLAERSLARTMELQAPAPPGSEDRLWQNFDPAVYRRWSGLTLQPLVLRQSPTSAIDDGLVREWRTAGGDVDKHRAYALQWFAMSAAAAAVTLYLVYSLRRDARIRQTPAV